MHANIRIHILHNVLYKFTMALTRRICLIIKKFNHFPHSQLMNLVFVSAVIMRSEIRR